MLRAQRKQLPTFLRSEFVEGVLVGVVRSLLGVLLPIEVVGDMLILTWRSGWGNVRRGYHQIWQLKGSF